MFNRSASLAMSTSVLEALPGKPDIKRHSPSILYIFSMTRVNNVTRKHGFVEWEQQRHTPACIDTV